MCVTCRLWTMFDEILLLLNYVQLKYIDLYKGACTLADLDWIWTKAWFSLAT